MCAVRAGGMDAVLREHTPSRAKRCFLVTSLHQQRSYPLARAEAFAFRHMKSKVWISAFAGMTSKGKEQRSGFPPSPEWRTAANPLDSDSTNSAVVKLSPPQ